MDPMRCIVHGKDGERETLDVVVNTKSKQDDRTEPAAESNSSKPGGRTKPVSRLNRVRNFFGSKKDEYQTATEKGREKAQAEANKLKSKVGGRTKGRLTNKNKRRSRKYKKTANHRKKSSRRRDIRRSQRRLH